MRVEVALRHATEQLARAGIEAPAREARLLALHVLGHDPGVLLDPAATIDEHAFVSLVDRRAAREPLAFITGTRGFWTLNLCVGPDTLIPRADSETLIEAALACAGAPTQVRRILDLGTGTGCLLLAALSEFSAAWGLGLDISPVAAALASRNAAANGLGARASFAAGNWAEAFGPSARFDLILCNPPYIASVDISALMPEVAAHEPRRALDGGDDGLRAFEALLPALSRLLQPQGLAILELGIGQHAAVQALAEKAGLAKVACRADLSGIPRALVLRRHGTPQFGS